MPCQNELYLPHTTDIYFNFLTIISLDPPSPPTSLTATFNSLTCSGTVELLWTPGASDRPIERYILYENGVEICVISPTNSYSHTKTLQNNIRYTYSIKSESCAGRSRAKSSNVISIDGKLIIACDIGATGI